MSKLQIILEIVHIIVKWIDKHFSARARRIKKIAELKAQAIKEKSKAKLLAACERLRKEKK